MIEAFKSKNSTAIARSTVEVAVACTALACSIFAHPLGMLVTTTHDMILNVNQLTHALKNKDYQKAAEIGLQLINNALYLGCFFAGSLEWSIASIGSQIFIGLYNSSSEFKKGNYLEGCGQLLMAGIRGKQMHDQIQILQYQYKIEKLFAKLTSATIKSEKLKKDDTSTQQSKDEKKILRTTFQIDLTATDKNNATTGSNHNSQDQQASGSRLEDVITDILLRYRHVGDPSLVIFHAATCGDVDAVKNLICFGADPLASKGYGNIVDCACKGDSLTMLKYLMEEKGLIPSLKDPFPLLIGRKNPFLDGVDYLLSKGYSFSEDIIFNSLYHDRNTGLTSLPSIQTLEFLISRGANVACLKDPKFSESIKVLLDLIFRGKILDRNVYGRSDIAEGMNSDRRWIDFFLGHGIDVNKKMSFIKCNQAFPDPNGNQRLSGYIGIYNTPLLIAIANNDVSLARNLIKNGANANFEGMESLLVKNPYDSNYHTQSSRTLSPLALALKYRHQELITLLLQNGARL